jgi:hypothetical protein
METKFSVIIPGKSNDKLVILDIVNPCIYEVLDSYTPPSVVRIT